MLDALASRLADGEPLYAALPGSFDAVGIDPYEAVRRLAEREWRASVLLEDLLPKELLHRIAVGEQHGMLVEDLRRAAAFLPRTLPRATLS